MQSWSGLLATKRKSMCYKLDVKKNLNARDLLWQGSQQHDQIASYTDYIIRRAVMKGWREWRYWDARQNLVIPNSILALLQDTCTRGRAALTLLSRVSELSPVPPPHKLNPARLTFLLLFSPQIFSNNYFHQPKVKNAIKHRNEIYSLLYSHIWTKDKEFCKHTKLLSTLKYSNSLP